MKVIAQINDNTVLCEVSQAEIARLHGLHSRYDKGWDYKWFQVGHEHDMAPAFDAVDVLRGFDNSQFRYMESRIKSMAESFDGVKDAYEKLMLLDTLSNKNTE